jgi:hypothetical protein
MAKGLRQLTLVESLEDDDLFLVNSNDVDKAVKVSTVKNKAKDLIGTAAGTLAEGNHRHDDRYVQSAGDILPNMEGATDKVSTKSLGSSDAIFKEAHVDSAVVRTISTDSATLASDFTFSAGKATMSYNPAEDSIDFIIN